MKKEISWLVWFIIEVLIFYTLIVSFNILEFCVKIGNGLNRIFIYSVEEMDRSQFWTVIIIVLCICHWLNKVLDVINKTINKTIKKG